MNLSIRKRIYWSFSVLVLLFVVNGIISIITLNENMKLSRYISAVVDPSVGGVEQFRDMLVESKMYSTNWVFLRSNQSDKDSLQKLHSIDYPILKQNLDALFLRLNDTSMVDSLDRIFIQFEQLIFFEKKIMSSLRKVEDYDDPVRKFASEQIIATEVLPRTATLMNNLQKIVSHEEEFKLRTNSALEHSFIRLRTLISILALTIICIATLLSLYFAKIILEPIHNIRNIINDLGRGILKKVTHKANNDEIGEMIHSVNNLSEKLQRTASFAREVGARNFEVRFQPLSDEDVLGSALIMMRDNLKKSEAELLEANAEIQTIYEASLDAVIIIDREGKITKWDRKSEALFGWTEDEVKGTVLANCIIPLRYREAHKRGLEYFLQTGVGTLLGKTVEVSALKKDTIEFDISLSISQILVKGKYRFIGFVRDITSRKKAEARLSRSEADLEIRNKQLMGKNTELEQFAYVASHDLQEPLRTTMSFIELFKRRYFGRFDAKADQYLSHISQASNRMSVLIKDLLDFSRIGINKDVENVDCNLVLQDVISDLDRVIQESSAEIQTEQLPVLSGYATELKQLFQNLIVNSIKFRKKDVVPKIYITAQKKDNYWRFAFTDNGIGIDQQYNERIFIIFQRLHNRSDYQGSGIGLSHCKKIVELHHGKIWVESAPDMGSTFYFTIHSPKQELNETKIKLHTAD